MIVGARQGKLSGLRQLVAKAMARELTGFLVPGLDIAHAQGLDVEAAGLRLVASPRHASVLMVAGDISPALRNAAAIIYAQMARPRALLVLGAGDLSPLPSADVTSELSQPGLIDGIAQLRIAFAEGAFRPEVTDFDAPMLHVRVEYTCPMHPEVVQDEPGSCPKCGMTLEPREASANDVDSHPHETHDHHHESHDHQHEVHNHDHGSHSHHHEAHDHDDHESHSHQHEAEDHQAMDHSGMNHGDMDHGSMDHGDHAFMSMIDVTKDLPRSSDGLPMDWIDVPFGPFFPGLPSGLLLTLTLDGDTVAGSSARTLTENVALPHHSALEPLSFVARLSNMEPLAPLAYRFLANQAMENAAGIEITTVTARGRVGALERERITSHLGWLALFGQQMGFGWLLRRAAALQLKFRHANEQAIMALKPDIESLIKRLRRTPLLKSRNAGIGRLVQDNALRGPVARAVGIDNDARSTDPVYTALGFKAISRDSGDSLARLQVRLDELRQSLALIDAAGTIELFEPANIGLATGAGEAFVETPRGAAHLRLTLEKGLVVTAQLETPSTHHLTRTDSLTKQQSLGDALLAVGSLDLSPWEIRQ
ncbi:heavy metal-binding domain-containing protein [Marinobacter sp.]|uniref:NADH-quinone oxidoreductase subunit D-related protein n=1 Tax=Marinobacter sp. TaxID=50741 RepID=UPI0025BBB087|nr:heavy metal-binding domain-containing protein [Marinobacter sp.]